MFIIWWTVRTVSWVTQCSLYSRQISCFVCSVVMLFMLEVTILPNDCNFYTYICLHFTFTTMLDCWHYLLVHYSSKILWSGNEWRLLRHNSLKITIWLLIKQDSAFSFHSLCLMGLVWLVFLLFKEIQKGREKCSVFPLSVLYDLDSIHFFSTIHSNPEFYFTICNWSMSFPTENHSFLTFGEWNVEFLLTIYFSGKQRKFSILLLFWKLKLKGKN